MTGPQSIISSSVSSIPNITHNTTRKMVSASKSVLNISLCLLVMAVAASTTQAQLSSVPKRHRTASNNIPQEFGRQQHQQRGQHQRKMADARRKVEDLSMPMTTAAELSMSLPMEEAITNKDALADNINLGTSPDERPYILASFLTGISAFVIGAVAMFVKMRQIHSREVEAQEEASAAQAREVAFGSACDDLEEDGEFRDVVIT